MPAMSSAFAELEPNVEPLGPVSDFVDEFVEAVSPQPFFADWSRPDTAMFSKYLDCYGVPSNSVVLREGEEGNFLAILVTGRALILKTFEGVEKVVHEMRPGELVGEMSLIDGKPRFASCLAVEPSDFAVLTYDNLNRLLIEEPQLGNKLLLKLLELSTQRLRKSTMEMLPGLMPWSA
jgi:CRP/FNR family cyclic AMP-dependent transcriptional regulator